MLYCCTLFGWMMLCCVVAAGAVAVAVAAVAVAIAVAVADVLPCAYRIVLYVSGVS